MPVARLIRDVFADILGSTVEMPEVARYITIPESIGEIKIPDPNNIGSDRHFYPVDAPGLVSGIPGVILFRTTSRGNVRFSVRLNSERLITHTFTQDSEDRSWHMLIRSNAMRKANNELVLSVAPGEGGALEGHVVFKDIAILYTSNELTVSKPLVLQPY